MMAFLQVRDAEKLLLITGPPGGESYSTDADIPRSLGDVQRTGDAFTEWDDDWQYPTLVNGWVWYGGSWNQPRYRRLPGGMVNIQGLVKSGTVNTTIFVLPEGYRPAGHLILAGFGNSAQHRLQINSSGAVYYPYAGVNSWLSLECTFYPGSTP